jgi:hypothetical protein
VIPVNDMAGLLPVCAVCERPIEDHEDATWTRDGEDHETARHEACARLEGLREAGFDRSYVSHEDGETDPAVKVRCSRCEALVINGVPCHEHGCPSRPRYCAECGSPDPDRTCCTPVEMDGWDTSDEVQA